MNITLSNGREIEILAINFRNGTIDFKWVNDVYKGECSFNMTFDNGIPSIDDIALVVETELGGK
jgi:hypothetical protein